MLHEDMLIDWNKLCQCGHKAIEHHGEDSRKRCDAGCQVDSNLPEWCRCALTATEVISRILDGDPNE